MSTEDLPATRISDHDRALVTDELQVAFADGRIDTDELESRLKIVNRAKFRSDLDQTTADLPRTRVTSPQSNTARTTFAAQYSPFLIGPIICSLIYAMTDFGGYFWPMWVWLGCAVPIVIALLNGDHHPNEADR